MKRTRRIIVTAAALSSTLGGAGLALTSMTGRAQLATAAVSPAVSEVPAGDAQARERAKLASTARAADVAARRLEAQLAAAQRANAQAQRAHDAAASAADQVAVAPAAAVRVAVVRVAAARVVRPVGAAPVARPVTAAPARQVQPVAARPAAPQQHATTGASGAAPAGSDDGGSGTDD